MNAEELDRLAERHRIRAYILRASVTFLPSFEDVARFAMINSWSQAQIDDAMEEVVELRAELIHRASILDPVRTVA